MTLKAQLEAIATEAEKATPAAQLTFNRYEHGGARLAAPKDWLTNTDADRKLVADFYDKDNREFYFASRTNVPRLVRLAQAQRRVIRIQEELLKAWEGRWDNRTDYSREHAWSHRLMTLLLIGADADKALSQLLSTEWSET